jgi:hypothetical protein
VDLISFLEIAEIDFVFFGLEVVIRQLIEGGRHDCVRVTEVGGVTGICVSNRSPLVDSLVDSQIFKDGGRLHVGWSAVWTRSAKISVPG